MKRTFLVSSILIGSLALGALGCSGAAAANNPTASATAAQTGTRIAPVAPQAKTMRVRLAADALSTIPLRDDQRAQIEQLASDAEARHAKTGSVHAQILLLLATQVEAGQIDRAALQPALDAAADAANVERPAEQAALVKLHDLLTPDQRAQFAEAMESRGKAKHAEHAEHAEHRSHMEKMGGKYQLTDDQQAQIGAALKAPVIDSKKHEFRAGNTGMGHGKKFLESFKGDTLTLPAPEDAHEHTNAMADHIVGIAQTVLPLLTPQQRTLAAAKIRERAAKAATDEEAATLP